MSFLKKILGFNNNKPQESKPIEGSEIEYLGFNIRATPFKSEGQYQSCGVISKEIEGEMKEHRFVRADRFSNITDAVNMIHIKARQIIDELGEELLK